MLCPAHSGGMASSELGNNLQQIFRHIEITTNSRKFLSIFIVHFSINDWVKQSWIILPRVQSLWHYISQSFYHKQEWGNTT